MNIKLGSTHTFRFTTSNPTTGALQTADSLPSVSVYEEATDTPILTPTPVNVMTGEYRVTVVVTSGNGFEVNKVYAIKATATVASVAGGAVIAHFRVDANALDDVAVPGDEMALIADAITAAKIADAAITSDQAPNLDAAVSTRSTLTQAQILSDTTPFAGASIALIKAKTDDLPSGIKKNTALANFMFLMIDSADHFSPKTGLTITSQRSLDGAAFGACANAAAEVASGMYKINLAATDLNADVVTLMFTATGADPRLITVVTEP